MRGERTTLLLTLTLLALLALTPGRAQAQSPDGWGNETRVEHRDQPPAGTETPDPVAQPAPGLPPESTSPGGGGAEDSTVNPAGGGEPGSTGSVQIPPPTAPPGWMFLADIHESLRWVLVAVLLVVAYVFPTLIFPGLIRRWGLTPGGAAALCLVLGGLATTPGVAALVAKQTFENSLPVPWWRQPETLVPAGIYMAIFLLLGIVAWLTGRSTGRA